MPPVHPDAGRGSDRASRLARAPHRFVCPGTAGSDSTEVLITHWRGEVQQTHTEQATTFRKADGPAGSLGLCAQRLSARTSSLGWGRGRGRRRPPAPLSPANSSSSYSKSLCATRPPLHFGEFTSGTLRSSSTVLLLGKHGGPTGRGSCHGAQLPTLRPRGGGSHTGP